MKSYSTSKPRLLILSHVLPFPGSAGQQQRVFYTLQSARPRFHVTFATCVAPGEAREVKEKLLALCDDVLVLPAHDPRHTVRRAWHKAVGTLYSVAKGLKYSNYLISLFEFSPARVASILSDKAFDCALFEYWHAARSTSVFRERGIPCLLDMHNILWQARERDLNTTGLLPGLWNRRAVRKYKEQEEQAWENFDGLITINSEEHKYVEKSVATSPRLFYAPMGTDLGLWPYSWQPVSPPRIAYYGALSTQHNQRDALRCYEKIMPRVWSEFPEAELWLIGSDPPESLRRLTSDPRVKVTGFVEDVQSLLASMALVLCPWVGTYGFRSRLIEVMALGVPLVTCPDAVYGMDLEHGKGLFLGADDKQLAGHVLSLIRSPKLSQEQSRLARQSVEERYSVGSTYERLMCEVAEWLRSRERKIA